MTNRAQNLERRGTVRFSFMESEFHIVRIEKLVFPGLGLAREDRFVLFVEGALPDECVRVQISHRRASYAHGRAIEVLSPSPWRRFPPCPAFGECGGCSWLHIAPEAQLRFKHKMLREVFQRAALSPELVQPVRSGPRFEFFRNKSSYSIGLCGRAPACGFHRCGSADAVVSARHCILQSHAAQDIVRVMEEFLVRHDAASWPSRVTVREGKRTGERMVLWCGPTQWLANRDLLNALQPLANTLVVECSGRGPVVVTGSGTIHERMCEHVYTIGPHDFFQTNTEVAEAMFSWIARQVGREPPGRIVEFHAGAAALSLVLAPFASEIVAVESERSAAKAAQTNLRCSGVENVRVVHARAEAVVVTCLQAGADWVVVDPPRTGLSAPLRAALAAARPRRFLYISCDPATLVRDLRELVASGLRLSFAQPFDMFPNSHHVETVVGGGWES